MVYQGYNYKLSKSVREKDRLRGRFFCFGVCVRIIVEFADAFSKNEFLSAYNALFADEIRKKQNVSAEARACKRCRRPYNNPLSLLCFCINICYIELSIIFNLGGLFMKRMKVLTVLCAAALLLSGCSNAVDVPQTDPVETLPVEEGPVRPQDDFYRYVNGETLADAEFAYGSGNAGVPEELDQLFHEIDDAVLTFYLMGDVLGANLGELSGSYDALDTIRDKH